MAPMTGKQRTQSAVHFRGPDKVPLLYLNRQQELGDLRSTGYSAPATHAYSHLQRNEWGLTWETLEETGETMGQPKHPPLAELDALATFVPPDPTLPIRNAHLQAFLDAHPQQYLMGGLGITGFNQATFLRGFEAYLEDLYLDPDRAMQVLDMILHFETGIIQGWQQYPLDAVSFGDDWGTQRALMIDPALWRKLFKPRFRKQFDAVHAQGKDVYFHCCGYIVDIIPDLLDIGVDILNLNQPHLLDVAYLGREFGGKVCFNCPVDHQTIALFGSREDIFNDVRLLIDTFGTYNGGFIGYIEDYHSIGMTEERYQWIVEAFETLRG